MTKRNEQLSVQQAKPSLDEINRSVQVPGVYEPSFVQKFLLTVVPARWLRLGIWIPVIG